MSDLNHPKVPEPDNLRDRIAAAIADAAEIRGVHNLTDADIRCMADAVIEALGLRVEHDAIDHTDNQPASHRYVTEWTTDE